MASNRIQFECPKCLASVQATTDRAGQRVPCPDCGVSLKIPDMVIGNQVLGDLFESESPTENSPASREQKTTSKTVDQDRSERADLFDDLDVDSLKFQNESERKPTQSPSALNEAIRLPDSGINASPGAATGTPTESEGPDESIIFLGETETRSEKGMPDRTDPFQYDEAAAIKIDGVSENITSEDIYGVLCPVCDTRIHVHVDQVGQSVECPICYSQVRVPNPPKQPELKPAWKGPAQAPPKNKENEVSRREKNDSFDVPIDESFGLAPVEKDLLKPRVAPEDLQMVPAEQLDDLQILPDENVPAAAPRKTRPARADSAPPPNESAVAKTPPRSPDFSSKHQITTMAILMDWLRRFVVNMELIIRTAMAVMFLSLAYMMLDVISSVISNPNSEFADKFVAAAMPVIGAILCLGIAALTLSIVLAIVLRDAAAGDWNLNQWPGFGPSEWFGSFAFVAFSLWVASLPGLVIGNIGWAMTDRIDVMLILTSISVFLLSPVCLVSALYNDSIVNIFAPEILKSFSQDSSSWTATYKFVASALGVFILGTLILYIPFFIFSFLGAIIHAVAIIAFALIVGLQAGRIIGDIQRNA